MKISLRKITLENLDDVVDLRLLDHQYEYLASNSYSIAEASLNTSLRTHAIYGDERVIGFVLYCTPDDSDSEPGTYEIWRLMIDSENKRENKRGQARYIHSPSAPCPSVLMSSVVSFCGRSPSFASRRTPIMLSIFA